MSMLFAFSVIYSVCCTHYFSVRFLIIQGLGISTAYNTVTGPRCHTFYELNLIRIFVQMTQTTKHNYFMPADSDIKLSQLNLHVQL